MDASIDPLSTHSVARVVRNTYPPTFNVTHSLSVVVCGVRVLLFLFP
jgi:hypothetical protein